MTSAPRLRVEVSLHRDVAQEADLVAAYEALPRSRRGEWVRALLVAGWRSLNDRSPAVASMGRSDLSASQDSTSVSPKSTASSTPEKTPEAAPKSAPPQRSAKCLKGMF